MNDMNYAALLTATVIPMRGDIVGTMVVSIVGIIRSAP